MAQANQKQGDYRNNKYDFGFLNTAQDPTDMEENACQVFENIDLDAARLGKIRLSDYASRGDVAPDNTRASIVVDDFHIDGGSIDYVNDDNTPISQAFSISGTSLLKPRK